MTKQPKLKDAILKEAIRFRAGILTESNPKIRGEYSNEKVLDAFNRNVAMLEESVKNHPESKELLLKQYEEYKKQGSKYRQRLGDLHYVGFNLREDF